MLKYDKLNSENIDLTKGVGNMFMVVIAFVITGAIGVIIAAEVSAE